METAMQQDDIFANIDPMLVIFLLLLVEVAALVAREAR